MSEVVPEDIKTSILQNIKNLEEAMQVENPDINGYILAISKNLKEFPDLVHILSDDEIAPLYHAMMSKANVVKDVKKSRSKTKSKGLLDNGTNPADLI